MGLPFERPAPALTAAESSELAQNVVLGDVAKVVVNIW